MKASNHYLQHLLAVRVVHATELSCDAVIPHIATKLSTTGGGLLRGDLAPFGWCLVHNTGVVFLLWNELFWSYFLLDITDIFFFVCCFSEKYLDRYVCMQFD